MEGVNGAVPVAPGAEDKGGPPPPSPLTGCYLLLVIAEPYTPQHKDIILQRIAKGLLSWNVNECLVDLEKELAIVTEQALEGEEARYGERLIQFASENLVTEILIHPVVSTLAQCMRNLLSSFTKHRHIIHAGYTFAANGSWALQDGTFSYTDFAEAFQELEVQRVIRAYENGITIDLHCSPEGDWTKLPKEQFTKACKVRLNPSDVLTSGSPAINNFINYISPFMVPTSLECLLESSDVVGNIRFSRPTLYVFPGGQGDAALFGINGFNMLLDGGYARKACFWDFVRHLDRLDAVLMTRLNNSNVGGISSVLRRKKQDALYPQIGHFFCNLQERKALLSPDGDKDRDPLLINLLDEGQEIVSNLRHLHLTPQVCYRDSEPINLYHKVGHGTLDMYILSPSKDSKELREFLHKWNQSDPKLFANAKSSREFSFPLQNLVSVAALIVWQPADPDDTITRILFPGSCPQAKVFEGLDRLKSLDFVKSAVCTEKSLSGTTTKKTAIIERIAAKDKDKIIADKKENKIIENNIAEVNVEVKEKTVKKSDSTESDRSIKQKKIEDHKMENGDRAKPKPRPAKPRSESQQRRKPIDKKASPKKVPTENGDIRKPTKPSPVGTPAKSVKDASNRKVIESKVKQAPAAATKPSAEPKPKVERKPISRRPKAMKAPISPVKKLVNGIQKPDSISKKGRLDKEGTTDSSTVSTPSVDQESVLKKDISKLTPEELQQLKAQELADLKEEQEAVKEIEAVFRKGEGVKGLTNDEHLRKVKDVSIDDDKLEEKEEYLIIEKEVIQQDSMDDKEAKEDETQKLARDSEESEKQRKPSVEGQRIEIESQINGIVTEAEDIIKSKDEHVEVSKVTSPEDKGDSAEKKVTDKDIDEVKDVVESQPEEKVSVNIKSGDTTTAPTLPEDERIPLDEIKEDNGQAIEEKHMKEDTKEKEVPVIRLPPKPADIVGKIPSVVGIKLDKQSHIRDIVKTPDEVADLPVHEEADFEYTQDLKAETVKTNDIVEDKKSDDKVKSKEETKMVESEKDSDELAQEKPKEVVPKMKEELRQLTDTVIKTELKTDTLGDKAAEDEKVEDQMLKKDEPDKKSEMDLKDTEHKIDIVEKQEEEEQEFKKYTTKEKSPEPKMSAQDIEKTADGEKEKSKADKQKGENVELSYDIKAEAEEQIRDKEQDNKKHTELHGPKTEKHEGDHKEVHLETETQKTGITEKHELQKSDTKQETVESDMGDSQIRKLDVEKPTNEMKRELQGDFEENLEIADNDVKTKLDEKDVKEYLEKDESTKEKTAGKDDLTDEGLKDKTDSVFKHTPQETEPEKTESDKLKDDGKSKDEKIAEGKISLPSKEKEKMHDTTKAKEETIESKIELELKDSKETTWNFTEEPIIDHTKISTEKADEREILTKPQYIDKHEVRQDTKDAEKEKDLTEKTKDRKMDTDTVAKKEDLIKDEKPGQRSHDHDAKEGIIKDEEKEKDIATPIEVNGGKSEPQKKKDIKQEDEHKIEKRDVEKVDVFEKLTDETSQEIKDHKMDKEPITNIEDLVKEEKKYDGKTDGDHYTKPEQKSQEGTKYDEKKENDITTPIEMKIEKDELPKDEDIKHEDGHKIEKREVEKDIDGLDKTQQEIKDHKMDAEPVTKTGDIKEKEGQTEEIHDDGKTDRDYDTKPDQGQTKEKHDDGKTDRDHDTKPDQGQTKEKHDDGKTDRDHDTKPDQTSYESEVKEETKDDEKEGKGIPIKVKEEKTEPRKEKDITHEDEHKIEKHDIAKDIDVSKKIADPDLPESEHSKQVKSAVVEKQSDIDILKHEHPEARSIGDEKEAVKPPNKLDMEQKEHIGGVMQNGVDAMKNLHLEDKKSTSEHADLHKKHDTFAETTEDSHKDNKKSIGEEKQKEIDEVKERDIEHEKSIVRDEQKDRDIIKERKKSFSEIEILELGRKSPMDLGRKSPKEREEDVIKIVASVAEVLKSDAPLEEFEGKLPIDTFTSFTSELRETHITTLDSPSAANGEIVKPEITSTSIEKEEKHETETTNRRSSLLKESQELMMATTKMISDIKTTKTDEKEDDEEVGTVHRMLVTASSEDGGEETEICPPGSITFSKSSESSGRSSPEHSQKLSQKSSIIDTASESLTTVRPVREQEEKDSGIDDVKSDTELPDQKSATEKDSGRESPAKKAEDASIKTISGKSTPDKDASIKSIASGKSTPDISDLEQSKDTDEFKKTEEEMSIETVEAIETEAVAKKDSVEVQHQKQETHVGDESKKIEDAKLSTDLEKVKEDMKTGDSHIKEEKEAKNTKEEQREETESEYIRDASPKELDYDASKVQNDKTPEKLPSKTSDQLKKEMNELQDSFIDAVSRDETPRKSSIPEDDRKKGEVESKIDLDHDQDKQLSRKASLKVDDLLKKEIQEVQESFIDSVAKDAVMVDGIDVDETSPRKMSLTDGRPLQDEIQECESKQSKAVDDSLKDVEDNFIESSKIGIKSESVSKQTDEFLKKEIEAVQDDSIESVSKDKKLEKLKDEGGKATRKLSLKGDELLKEGIKQLQEGFVEALTEDTYKKEKDDEVERKMTAKDEILEKDVKNVHDNIDEQKQALKEYTAKGIHETTAKSTDIEKIDTAPQKAVQLLKKEIDEVQEEFIESVSKDFEVGTMIKQDLEDTSSKQATEQQEHDSKVIKEKQVESEEKISYHTLPKAEYPEKVVDPTKATDAEEPEQEKLTPPRRSSSKASELLKEEIKEMQDGFVDSITRHIADETKTVIESVQKIDENLSLKSEEMKEGTKSGHSVLQTGVEEVQGQAKKDTVESDKVADAAQKNNIIDTQKIEEGHKEPIKKSSKSEEILKKEIKDLQQTFIEGVASEVKTSEIILDPSEPKTDKPFEKVDETTQEKMYDIESIHMSAEEEQRKYEFDTKSPREQEAEKDGQKKELEITRRASLKADELLKEEIKEVQEGFIESVSKDISAEEKQTNDDKFDTKSPKEHEAKKDEHKQTLEIARRTSIQADELLKEEIKEVQEGFIESVSKDISAEEKQTNDDKFDTKSPKEHEAKKYEHKQTLEIARRTSIQADELLKEEIKEVQEGFIQSVSKDMSAEEKQTKDDKFDTKSPKEQVAEKDEHKQELEIARRTSIKADELLKEEIKEVQEGFIESVSKDMSAEEKQTKDGKFDTKSPKDQEAEKDELKKELEIARRASLKADELLKEEIKEVQEGFIESVSKDMSAEEKQTKDGEFDTKSPKDQEAEKDELKKELEIARRASLKADELLKEEIKEVQESFIESVSKDMIAEEKQTNQETKEDVLKKESHSDVESSKKEHEAKDTIIDGISADRKSSLTPNGLIKDTKSHQKQESNDTKAKSETEQGIQADEIKKAIQDVQDEFIESVAEDFVLIDRIKKDDIADPTETEEATTADQLDSKAKSPPAKESSEKTLERSAAELTDTFNKVSDMTKSVIFDKCETSAIDPAVVKKDEEELEDRAKDTIEAYETVNELAKTISFEKLMDKRQEEKVSVTAELSKSTLADDTDSSKIDETTLRKDEKMLEKQADDIEDAYETVSKLVKSITFEKVEEDSKVDEATLKQDAKLLKQKAGDIEDAYETVSNLAKSISFEKVEGALHIDEETLKNDEKVLEQRADAIEDAYDTVTELAKNIPFEKVESHSQVDQTVIKHDEKLLEQTAGDVEMAYETVTKLAKRISFEKVEDKSEKDKVSADASSRTTMQEHEANGQSQASKEIKGECVTELSSSITGSKQHSEPTVVESKHSETDVAEGKTGEKERKDSISQARKESLPTSDHANVDIHSGATLEVTQSRSEAKKLSITEVEILLTDDKFADDKQLIVGESYEKQISGGATPPTVPVSPNIKDASSPEAKYTESDIRFTATEQMDPMCMSFYGSLPEDEKIDEDTKEGEVTHLFEITKAKFSTPMSDRTGSEKGQPGQTEDQPSSSKEKDSSKDLGKPLGLPPPPHPTYLYEITKAKYSTGTGTGEEVVVEEEVQSSYVYRETDMMNTSFYGSLPTDEDDFDPLRMWGKPLGLPSPAPPNDNKGTPKRDRKLPSNVSAKNRLNDDKKRAESPSKHNRNRKNNPIYVDLTYVPHHGNTYYAYVDFFKRIRARYYVFSGIEPSREVYNALLEAKQTWEDKELEVTIIPTYDTDVLGYWVAENEDLLAKFKIDLSPSASRCTINLQDHETSCSAYRLEF